MQVDLLKQRWHGNSSSVRIDSEGDRLLLVNASDHAEWVPMDGPIACAGPVWRFELHGECTKGNAAILNVICNDNRPTRSITLNSVSMVTCDEATEGSVGFTLPPQSETRISLASYDFLESIEEHDEFLLDSMKQDVLVITPLYPTPDNLYAAGFVHSRVSAYQQAGLHVDVACINDYNETCRYSIEGVSVLRTSYVSLRKILRRKRYSKILVHFFDERYALALDSCYLGDAQIVLWVHNPEACYWEEPIYAQRYFEAVQPLTQEQRDRFERKDAIVKRYNDMPNVSWVFVSDDQRRRAEKLIGIEFNHCHVIANLVDERVFPYKEKDRELRKKVFMCRRFDNYASYSMDTCVRTIIELSRRPCFDDMEFDIYGHGSEYDRIVEPVRAFPNVHLHPHFLSHEEMSAVHAQHGIALFPTRYDSQGVSALEAAMSGLAVVSTDIEAPRHFLPNDLGLLGEQDNYIQHADCIERLYNDPDYFAACSLACHEKAYELCRSEVTTGQEVELIRQPGMPDARPRVAQVQEPILSVVIPAYNAGDYLRHGVYTLINQAHASWLDIIIVNDGSSDDTADVAREIMENYNDPDSPVISLVNKENGGHGSTINTGVPLARGKYLKIMDSDDWFDSAQFELLLETLAREDADIVLSDYSEDQAVPSVLFPVKNLFAFMTPGLRYRVDDVCVGSYGFPSLGPAIATGCFKTSMLQQSGIKLTEHCFYVDLEFNLYAIKDAESIVYYPYNVYRYLVGRVGQSCNERGFIIHRKERERVLINLLEYVYAHPELSQQKHSFLINNLVARNVRDQYRVVAEVMGSREDFLSFDQALSQWPEIYNNPAFTTQFYTLHRRTKGKLLKFNKQLLWLNETAKRMKRR